MATRYHTTRHSQEDLRRSAFAQATPAQFELLGKLHAMGWQVASIYGLPKAPSNPALITLTVKSGKLGAVGALYPDGKFARNVAGQKSIKLNTDWAKPGDWTF